MLNFIFARDLLSAFGLSQKKIAQILNRPGATIEELLQEEETISECKALNNKLLEFITQPQNMSKLIKYITQEPTDPNNRDRTYKYPFVASDILSSCLPIVEALLKAEDIKPEHHSKEEEKHRDNSDSPPPLENQSSPPQQKSPPTIQAENDTQLVQNILQQQKEEKTEKVPEKEQLVDDLEQEITGDEEDANNISGGLIEGENNAEATKDAKQQEIVGKADEGDVKDKNLAETTTTTTEENKKQDNNDEDPNVDGENEEQEQKDGSNKGKFEIKTTQLKNKPFKQANDEKLAQQQQSYKLLDELVGFLEQDEVIPILCGYFTKVVSALLNRAKAKFLQYVLITKEGELFNKLLKHLEHHSLAQLLVELMQVKIGSDRGASEDWDKNSDDGKNKSDQGDDDMTPTEQHMFNVLRQKKQEVITHLISKVSSQGTDFEQCLNAQTILNELSENESSFMVLIKTANMTALFESACDINNKNQAYAINILTHIFKEYPDHDKNLSTAQMQEFQQLIAENFLHVIYQCIILLRSIDLSASEKAPNQTDVLQRRVGLKKLRALELIKQSMQTLSKYSEQQNLSQHINKIMKKQIINTMLFMLENCSFSSITNQLSIQVLDQLKSSFDQDDVALLKGFVQRQLSNNMEFEFQSGRKSSSLALGQVVQMALELKSLSQMSQNEENSDDQWVTFCNTHVRRAEERWTKKLEDYDYLPSEEDTKTEEDEPEVDIEAQIYHDEDGDDADERDENNENDAKEASPNQSPDKKEQQQEQQNQQDDQTEQQTQQEIEEKALEEGTEKSPAKSPAKSPVKDDQSPAKSPAKEESDKQEDLMVKEEQKEDKEFNQVSIRVLLSTKRKQSIEIGSVEPIEVPQDAAQKKHKDDWEVKISQDKTLKKAFLKLAAEEPSIDASNEIIKEILSVPAEAESAEDQAKASIEEATTQEQENAPEQTKEELKSEE